MRHSTRHSKGRSSIVIGVTSSVASEPSVSIKKGSLVFSESSSPTAASVQAGAPCPAADGPSSRLPFINSEYVTS